MRSLFDFESVYRAYIACRRGKRMSRNTQRYEVRLLDQLVETTEALQSRRWQPARSVAFVCTRPKSREIHAADFADRVVHHLLVPKLEALYEPIFIYDSYSNRKEKGTHAAVARLQSFMQKASKSGKERAYFLQLDIRNFFNRIDRRILLSLLQSHLEKSLKQGRVDRQTCSDIYWLCQTLLDRNPAEGAILRGDRSSFEKVPAYKQLANAPEGTGIAIGNLTSQFFANVYLHELDQFIKHTLKCRYYLRYVDDFVLLDASQNQLANWYDQIEQFLTDKLGLALKEHNEAIPVSSGCDFLGYVVRPGYRLVRRRVVGHCRDKLQEAEAQIIHRNSSGATLNLQPEWRDRLQATLASYRGHFKHAGSFKLEARLFNEFHWLSLLFANRHGKLSPKWQPERVWSLHSQWQWFHTMFQGCIQLMQLGHQVICANGDIDRLPRHVRSLMRSSRELWSMQQVRAAPIRQSKTIRAALRSASLPHLFVSEEGYLRGGFKRRVLRLLWMPSGSAVTTI
ncbi:MAG: reverse transcriptase domain-containing protein [Mariprofundaceae bacterium]